MDRDSRYRDIVKQTLTEAARLLPQDADLRTEIVFDDAQGHYQVGQVGWQGKKRIDNVYLHVDVLNGKVWLQYDGTELCLAEQLVKAGIPREHIVLGFETGEYEIDEDDLTASMRAFHRRPEGVRYGMRIGSPSAGTLGASQVAA